MKILHAGLNFHSLIISSEMVKIVITNIWLPVDPDRIGLFSITPLVRIHI